MKRRNGFFSFSIMTVAVLTLSLALTAATLAWQHFQMARTYEETVRLTYLAESALCEGWTQLRQDPDAFLAGQAIAVPRAEGLTDSGDILSVRCHYQPVGQAPAGYLQARAAAPEWGVQQTCGLHFTVTADGQGRTVLNGVQYVN
ncbi:hypothetical protein [uncultured Megasphaera sp.]|mgnify:CR=1 FL=1|uniref:hypothetical protein n=1 Tax=uncultured Megasphaera sp. TaxID=165188 RepID=UPI002603C2D7|nr:hypothetical protein [uncultured Megasphaera sp.]